jgi:hypothetical protein
MFLTTYWYVFLGAGCLFAAVTVFLQLRAMKKFLESGKSILGRDVFNAKDMPSPVAGMAPVMICGGTGSMLIVMGLIGLIAALVKG